ncbi:hypothetical protein [Endozoicomonas sp. ALB091]|uniref:hypothetical protein n=1 Tax=Endozoicomonas sp. ALB091 TaxID=3403073 RepID=UPI003BB7247B
MQGIILKAAASTSAHPKSARWVDQQASSSRLPYPSISAFYGKSVSNLSPHRVTGIALYNGKCVEDAFWEKKPLQGRQVTSADVLTAYGNDTSSIRSGFFLQKLCLQNILHGNRVVTPIQVIEEFSRQPDQNHKFKLAIARFMAECCLMGLNLNGHPVTPDSVVMAYHAIGATLELARFKSECCLRYLLLNGRQVTPDEVVRDYPDSPGGKLGIARFKTECCLKCLPLNGRLISPEEVVKDYPDSPDGRLGIARFIEECCLRGWLLNGQQVTPDEVVKYFPDSPVGKLGIVRFKAECCLNSLPLHGQQVTADEVVKEYQVVGAPLSLARFKAECCLRSLLLHGRQVTPETVVKDYQAAEAPLELARFKAECCQRGLLLNGQRVTPDAVVKDYQAINATLPLARFKAQCCLRGLPLNGQRVLPDAVARDYRAVKATLELAHFKEQCCFRGKLLNGQQVTPDEVVKEYRAARATLGLARFKAECCLRGMLLNGRQVTTAAVVNDFPASPEGKLGAARFKMECCLRGLALNDRQIEPDMVVKDLPKCSDSKLAIAHFKAQCCLRSISLNGQQVTPHEVVKGFQAIRAKLALACFKAECCLKGMLLNGQQVTAAEVIKDFPVSPEGKLGLGRFKAECCLRGLPLKDRPVTPDTVVEAFPDSPEGKLGIVRFKAECCFRGLLLNGQQVNPDEVAKDYVRGGWLLERAIFYSQLALNARIVHGSDLDNQRVLAAFNTVPGDHSSRQTRFLIQRLEQFQPYDEASEVQAIFQEACQTLNNLSVNDDEQHRVQCILKFMALQHELPMNHQSVSAQQVLQSINTLRRSFQNLRLHFFFLAHCYSKRLPIDGRQIHKDQVLECLNSFPEGSKQRHALGCWFEQYSTKARILDQRLFQPVIPVSDIDNSGRVAKPLEVSNGNLGQEDLSPPQVREFRNAPDNASVAQALFSTLVAQTRKQWPKTGAPGFPDKQAQRLDALTLKALEIIQDINRSYANPPILITGSYARFLQNLCPAFNDIDIICTTEKSATILFEKLQALNTDEDSEITQNITFRPVPGCQAIKLPQACNIDLRYGDLGIKTMGLQVSVDSRVIDTNGARLAVHVPGVERPVWCLSFTEETRLLNDALAYLVDNLDPLTRKLQRGVVFDIPRTLLFNKPQNAHERIYGLLIRSLLTLNKGRQFIALHCEEEPETSNCRTDRLQQEQHRLHVLTGNLQIKLASHVCRDDFERRVNGWLATAQLVNDYQVKRKDFVKELLTMMNPE